jgi:hypothetical protein
MTGYQGDQFFGIGNSRPDDWKNRPVAFINNNSLNNKFIYPDNTIRVPLANGTYSTTTLQKGYIRRINEFDDGNQSPLICRFQFNPQFLTQQASFQSGIVNPIYQPIEQLKQPIASMTQFGFSLRFDRSMELNNAVSRTRTASDNPWSTGGPEQVGVLHDLNALFRVIGQGISENDVQNAAQRAEESLAAVDARVGKDELTEEETSNFNAAVANSAQFFANNVNVGNTAFILPYPVRIVFSSLYIVEGFITSTSLELLKFNSAYVPMMASVTLGVSALYIGFAKTNTYFTHVLAQSAADRRNELDAATAAQNADVQTLRRDFNKLHIKFIKRPNNRPAPGNPSQVTRFNNLFSGTGSVRSSDIAVSPTDWIAPRQTGTGSRPVAVQFESGDITSLSFKWRATLFGPLKETATLRRGRSSLVDFSRAQSVDEVINDPLLKDAKKVQSSQGSISVTTKQEWLDLSDPLADTFYPLFSLSSLFSAALESFNSWILVFEAEVTVTLNGRTYDAKSFTTRTFTRSSTSPLSAVLNFDWSRFANEVSDASSATNPDPVRTFTPGEVYSGPFGTVDPGDLRLQLPGI